MSEQQKFLEALFGEPKAAPEPEHAQTEQPREVSAAVIALNARLERIGRQVAEEEAAQAEAAKPPPEPTAEQALLARHAERERVATLRTLGFKGPSLEVSPGFDGGVVQPEPGPAPLDRIYVRDTDE